MSATSSRGRGRGGGGGTAAGGSSRRAAFGGSITTSEGQPAGSSSLPAQGQRGGSRGGGGGGGGGGARGGHSSGGGGGGGHANRRQGKQRARNPAEDSGASGEAHATSAQRAAESHAAAAAAAVLRADAEAKHADPATEFCFICAEPVRFYSVAPCDHRTCHVCAIRLRALYKKMECTFCKTASDRLIFTTSPSKTFAQFLPTDIPFSDSKLSISFETQDAYEQTLLLLRFNCPNETCEVVSAGWSDLKAHARRDHGRLLCDLCIRFKKIFAHEHELHTSQSLQAHLSRDHGRCDYCKEYFYSDDELYVHMRDNHEQCHICKARGGEAERWTYYRDYSMLETHFRDEHYLCMNRECLEKRFVVFESEMDFKAHQLAEHANELSTRERREALRVDAHFHFEDSTSHGVPGAPPGAGQGRRGGGGRGEREADVRASQGGVGGGAASRRANFGGALTSDAPASSGAAGSREDAAAAEARIFARTASILGSSSDSKQAALKSVTSAFRASECSARDLVLTVFSLVDSDVDRANALFQALVGTGSGPGERGLFEEEEKRTDVLTSWNAIRIERTQFPSLSGAHASTSSSSGAHQADQLADQLARTQIRNIKSTSSASSNRVWENVERAAGSSSAGASAGPGPGPGRYGLAAARNANHQHHFPALGAAPVNPGSVNVPGSARHAAAASAAVRTGAAARSGGTVWSSSGGAGAGAGGGGGASRPASNTARSGGNSSSIIVPTTVHVSNGSGSGGGSRSAAPSLPSSAFPSLPTNANAAALAAQKRALLAKGKEKGGTVAHSSAGSSGAASPALGVSDGWGAGATMSRGGGAASGSGSGAGAGTPAEVGGEEGLAAGGGGGGKKKKGKGVVLLSMGGMQRG